MDDIPSDKLEKAFREIEAESERRAAKEAEEAKSEPGPLPVGLHNASTLNAIPPAKQRRRGSISVSRLGNRQYAGTSSSSRTESNGSSSPSQPTSPLTANFGSSRSGSQILYQHDAGSASSLTSDESNAHTRPENHTTQKETIIGRRNTISKAVGGMLKSLPHMRSTKTLSDLEREESVVIGVSVSEATVEQRTSRDRRTDDIPLVETKSRILRTQSSSQSITGENTKKPRKLSMMAKAVGRKLRPKRSHNSIGGSDG